MGKERTFLSDLAKREGEDQIHPAGVMLFSLSYRLVVVYVNQNNCKCSHILDGLEETKLAMLVLALVMAV